MRWDKACIGDRNQDCRRRYHRSKSNPDLDLSTRQYIWSHVSDCGVLAIPWSYDRTRLAVGTKKDVKIFDLASNQCIWTRTATGGRSYTVSVSWSRDGSRLASLSSEKTVKIWDLNTGQCEWTLKVGDCDWLQFDEVNSNILHTNLGTLDLLPRASESSSSLAIPGGLASPRRVGYGLKDDRQWITFDGHDLLWLPPEYRPDRFTSAISGTTVAIGCSSGRVLILTFSESNPLLLVSQMIV